MKKLTMSLLTLALIMLLCGSAYATEFEARGSAVVTGMMARYNSSSSLRASNIDVTNISGSDVDCRITFYDQDGNDVTQYCKIYAGSTTSNGSTLIATGTGSFTLPAGATRFAQLVIADTSLNIHGHAVIEWASADTHIRKALIASAVVCLKSNTASEGYYSVSVNGDQPF